MQKCLLQNVSCICINCIEIVAAAADTTAATMQNRPLERQFLFLSPSSPSSIFSSSFSVFSSPFDEKQCDEERTATTRRKFIIWNRGILTSYLFLCVRHARRALTNLILIIFCDQIVFLFLASFFLSIFYTYYVFIQNCIILYMFFFSLFFSFSSSILGLHRVSVAFFSSLPIQFTVIAQPQANLVNLVSLVPIFLFVCVSYFQFRKVNRLVVQNRLNLVTTLVCIMLHNMRRKIKSIFNCVSPSKYLRSMYSSVIWISFVYAMV